MFCKKCGNVVAKYDHICPHCGNNLRLPTTPEQEAKYTKNLILISIIITAMILVAVGFISININKEEKPPVQLSGVHANIEYEKKLYASWVEEDGENILELNEDGSFIWYKNKFDMENNYIKGFFAIENGCRLENDRIYEFQGYLFYEIIFTNMQVLENGIDVTNELPSIQTKYIFRLEKEKQVTGSLVGIGIKETFILINSKNLATTG